MEPYEHDLTDPAWLDEFLQEDLKNAVQPNQQSQTQKTFVQPPPSTQAPPKTYKRSQSMASVFTVDEAVYSQQNNTSHLLERFRFLKKRQKLNLQKLSEMLGVSKAELQKFSSGKDRNCTFLDRIQNWIYCPSNSDALRCFERDNRRAVLDSMSNVQQQPVAPASSFTRTTTSRGAYETYKTQVANGQNYKNSYYYPQQHVTASQRNPVSGYAPGSGRSSAINPLTQPSGRTSSMNQVTQPTGRTSSVGYMYSEPAAYMREREKQSQVKQEIADGSKLGVNHPLATRGEPAIKNKWQNNESIDVLSQMLKRDTHKLLHKGIDSAIEEYLEHSKALRDRIKAQGGDSRQNDYFYKKQGKVLLNRLTAICGEEAVNRATSYLSELKTKRSGMKMGRNWTNVEMQKLAHLTQAWNHACSCKIPNCDYPNCRKIKPAVLHQLRLKDERRRTGNPSLCCNISNCEPCLLYNKLKKFSTTARKISAPAPNHGPNFPTKQRNFSSNSYKNGYAEAQKPRHPQGSTQPHPSFAQSQTPKGDHQRQLVRQSPYQHTHNSYSSQSNTYSTRNNFSQNNYPNRSGSRAQQIYNQQNNITTNMQNINNTNVSYNTYTIHTNATPATKTETTSEVEETDMSAVAEMLDDSRKHKLNINVKVNVESLYGGASHKRKADSKQEYNYNFVKEKRTKGTPNDGNEFNFDTVNLSQPQDKSTGNKAQNFMSNKDPTEVDPVSFIPDVEEDFASLFPMTSAPSDAPPPIPLGPAQEVLPQEKDNSLNAKEDGNGRKVLCVVCHGKERDALFKPCNHCCACMNCARKLRVCPMCRRPVDSTNHIFLS